VKLIAKIAAKLKTRLAMHRLNENDEKNIKRLYAPAFLKLISNHQGIILSTTIFHLSLLQD
jgi:hypothetical protein